MLAVTTWHELGCHLIEQLVAAAAYLIKSKGQRYQLAVLFPHGHGYSGIDTVVWSTLENVTGNDPFQLMGGGYIPLPPFFFNIVLYLPLVGQQL